MAAALAKFRAEEVEERVFAAGGIATAVRALEVWQAHRQGQALAAAPLISHRRTGDSSPRPRSPADLPKAGVRVLDLARVIAGPVCTRFLGALGAEVLRLDPPNRPDMQSGVVTDSLLGKRSSFVNLDSREGVATLHCLLARADEVVCSHSGPWAGRRGFDSVVQAPTGIAMGESATGREPGALPCQLLDHATGYLAAALAGIRRQSLQGGNHVKRLSLARTASWLTSQGTQSQEGAGAFAAEPDSPAWLVELDSARGLVTVEQPLTRSIVAGRACSRSGGSRCAFGYLAASVRPAGSTASCPSRRGAHVGAA